MKYLSSLLNRAILLGAGVSLFVVGLAKATENVRSVTATKAFVNGKIVSIDSPIGGQVQIPSSLESGELVRADHALLKVVNNLASSDVLRNLEMELAAEKAKLTGLNSRIRLERSRELSPPQPDLSLELSQTSSAIQLAQQSILQAQAELKTAEKTAQLFQTKSQRFNDLVSEGAVPQTAADEVQTAQQGSQNQVEVMRSKVAASELQLAQQQRQYQQLQLKQAGQTSPNPEALKTQQQTIAVLMQDKAELQAKIREKEKAIAQLRKSADYRAVSANNGIVWEVLVQNGDQIAPGQPLVKVIDCNRLWVDAFVNIDDLPRVQIDSPVEVELRGSPLKLKGRVRTVRSHLMGTPRIGQDAAVMPPNLDSQQFAQVRIELQDTAALNTPQSSATNFCRVGQLAQVKIGEGALLGWRF
jgi:multidrug resistance efflux pump